MFQINVSKKFASFHALRNYKGRMEEPHEHEFKCELAITSNVLDQAGCAVDFVVIDKLLDEVLAPIKNKQIHETDMFKETSPSAENIAKYIYDRMAEAIDDDPKMLTKVTVWEDENHSASYVRDT